MNYCIIFEFFSRMIKMQIVSKLNILKYYSAIYSIILIYCQHKKRIIIDHGSFWRVGSL